MDRYIRPLVVTIVSAATTLNAQKQTPQPLPTSSAPTRTAVAASYTNLPLSFEPNVGQSSGDVKFLSRGRGYSRFLTTNQAVLSLKREQSAMTHRGITPRSQTGVSPDVPGKVKPTNGVLHMTLVGASPEATVQGVEELPGKSNYFIGSNPTKWRTNVPTYAKVKYRGVYSGIDLVYYGNQEGQLEYDFIVAPGTDPKAISLLIDRETNGLPDGSSLPASIDTSGDITLRNSFGDMRFQKPVVYQEDADGHREYRDAGYVLDAGGQPSTISFRVGNYDRRGLNLDVLDVLWRLLL